MTSFSPTIPPSRALVPSTRAVPALRQVALATRPLQLARVARAAGALAVGLAAEGVLRTLLARRDAAAATADAALSFPAIAALSPFEAARAIEGMRGAGRLIYTEFTVTEKRWGR